MTEGILEIQKKRRRLLWIAGMTSTCLLLNTISTVSISSTLDEWSQTADIFLTCSIGENWNTRNLKGYGFEGQDSMLACTAKESMTLFGDCTSACVWDPSIRDNILVCERESESVLSYTFEAMRTGDHFNPCDCPCNHLVQVKKPR
jgi:hypothetical protein